MKTKLIPNFSMKLKNSVYVFGSLLIGIAVCVLVWELLREHKGRGILGHERTTPSNNGRVNGNRNTPQLSQNLDGNLGGEELSAEERLVRLARHGKRAIMSRYSEEELATPRVQKELEAYDSPEFIEFLKHPSARNWFDFWESKGLPKDRGVFNELFRGHFPTGEPEDYESEMRLKIAKIFLAAEPVDLRDPEAAAQQRREVFSEFRRKDTLNAVWHLGQFDEDWDGALLVEQEGMGNNPALAWIADVQRNAASIVAKAEAMEVDVSDVQESAPSWDLSEIMESPPAWETGRPDINIPSTDASNSSITPNSNDRAAPEPGLTDMSSSPVAPPSVESLEAALKSQFSSERFDRAMSTLERYGPEEGLRRLRANDPEVAKQIERHRSGERRDVSQ